MLIGTCPPATKAKMHALSAGETAADRMSILLLPLLAFCLVWSDTIGSTDQRVLVLCLRPACVCTFMLEILNSGAAAQRASDVKSCICS
jgi:cytochrome b